MTAHAWVIGEGGLLGSAIRRAIERRDDWMVDARQSLPWNDPAALRMAVATRVRRLVTEAGAAGDDWVIIWAAGSAVTSTGGDELTAQLEQFSAVLEEIESVARESHSRGSLFFSSSAGGLYGGSAHPPFDEDTEPIPVSEYGRAKLAMELRVTEFGKRSGVSVLIGRIANVYGPGQRITKPQGLISQLILSHFTHRPAHIYVPLETTRNYIYVDDCARVTLACLDRLRANASRTQKAAPQAVVKIIASRQNLSIAVLLGYLRALGHRPASVALGAIESGAGQPIDLRLRSIVWTDLDLPDETPIVVGFHATLQGILTSLQSPSRTG